MTRTSRRELLDYLTRLGLFLPALPSVAYADKRNASVAPKRLIILFTGNGQYADHWYPHKSLVLDPMGSRCRGLALDKIDGPISPIFDRSFDRFRSKINLLRGLDLIPCDSQPHGMPKTLNGYGDEVHPTLDQIIAESAAVYPEQPLIRSLHLKNKGNTKYDKVLSIHPKTGKVFPIERVELAYDKVFYSNFRNPRVKELLEQNFARNIDKLKVAREDRDRLAMHLTLLRNFSTKPISCTPISYESDLKSDRQRLEAYNSLIAAVVKCDLSRVIAFSMTESEDEKVMPYTDKQGGFHAVTHITNEPWALDSFFGMQKFHAEIVLDLLHKLDEVEDYATGTTFLDNSLVIWIGEQAVRQSDTDLRLAHDSNDLPMFMAGSLGGTIKTGQYLNFQGSTNKIRGPSFQMEGLSFPPLGRALNEWQISIMTAMGLVPSDWEQDGEPGFGAYRDNINDQYQIGDRRRVLTQIFA